MTRLSVLLILSSFFPSLVFAQPKVVRGNSDAHSGMLFYDVEKATDKQEKRFLYTICPEQARCLQLDFSLIQSALDADFIRFYAGENADGPPIQQLGGESGDRLFQYDGSCITVEFLRDDKGLNTAWSLLWKSEKEGDCIRSGERDDDCPYVTEICGPEYREPFQHFATPAMTSQAVEGSCLDQPKRSSWYKFVAQQEGNLEFIISPANSTDDLDWVLWRVDSTWTDPCPDSLEMANQLACNYAAGRGPKGATGMNSSGGMTAGSASGNPFRHPLPVAKGDVFYLLVNDYSSQSKGFTIRFNEVVLACTNPVRTFVPINHQVVSGRPQVPAKNLFSKYTRILRLDLNEKANQSLANSSADELAWDRVHAPNAKALPQDCRMTGMGIQSVLINGLKLGRFMGYSCEDMATPIHFGDLLRFVSAQGYEAGWDGDIEGFDNFSNHLELIIDEIFDRNSGRKRQVIRMIRLIWSSPSEGVPDYNMAVFQYDEVAPYLDEVGISNGHNDVQTLSIKDFLEGQMYTAIPVHQRHQNNRTLEEASHQQNKEVEFEAFHWGR